MIHEKIYLREETTESYITTYILDEPLRENGILRKKPLVLVIPGGGYSMVSLREGEPIAMKFNSLGFNAVVLNYIVNAPYPQSLIDASNAVVYIREHAAEWNVDADKIFVCGFSAGGHLAASIAIMNDKDDAIKREDGMNKVNGMILSYPVITSGEKAHRGSFDNIGATNEELLKKTSLELQVDENTPPAFIWHTFSDTVVPVENSLFMANALREQNIPFELHIYPEGPHGLSLSNEITGNTDDFIVPHVQGWIDLAAEWITMF